ncbi:hypothetical protein GC194_01280 [bacterium]|nr:hypothetical protein [bacterium]
MIKESVHILNGDVLRRQMPQSIRGRRIIFREMLIEGPIIETIDENFWQQRQAYLLDAYEVEPSYYDEKSRDELLKMNKIARDATVHMWFDFDAFCFVHLLFTAKMLVSRKYSGKAYWVRPMPVADRWNGFDQHSTEQLQECLADSLLISPIEMKQMAKCWDHFANKEKPQNTEALHSLANIFPQIQNISDILTYSRQEVEGLPYFARHLLQTANENPLENEELLTQQFKQKWPHAGYSDLQMKHLYHQIKTAK